MNPDQKLAHNERTKLLATFFNGLGIALFAVGGLAPIATMLNTATLPSTVQSIAVTVCFSGAGILHLLGRRVLRRLKA